MKEIQLTQGKVTRVDDADFAILNQHKWSADRHKHTFYAVCAIRENGKRKTLRMHCAILGQSKVDHEDGDGLNNQRYNLRQSTQRQNVFNRAKQATSSGVVTASKYKGVSAYKGGGKVSIGLDGKQIHIGVFKPDEEVSAAKAYDKMALQLFGEFARLNFPLDNHNGL